MSPPDQAATLRGLRTLAPPAKVIPLRRSKSRAIAVSGGKGGVGKSTLAVNLALAYSAQGARTLAFDGDLGMADLNLLLGVAPARSLQDVLAGMPIEEVLVEAHGIHLLPALNGGFQLANLDARSRDRLLGAVDELVARHFETMIIDTAAGISQNNIQLTGAARDVVVVATSEPLSLADAYASLKVMSTRQGLSRAFIVPNSVRSAREASEIGERLSALVARFLGISLEVLPGIPLDPAVREAAADGVPLLVRTPDAPASRAIKKLARALDLLTREGSPSDADRASAGA